MVAFDAQGEPFDPPSRAVGWRVRVSNRRGHPTPIAGEDGLPLVVAIDIDPDELRETLLELGARPGRYRLDPVDENHRTLDGEVAYWELVGAGGAANHGGTADITRALLESNQHFARTIADALSSVSSQVTAMSAQVNATMEALRATKTPPPSSALVAAVAAKDGEDKSTDWTPLITECAPLLRGIGEAVAMIMMKRFEARTPLDVTPPPAMPSSSAQAGQPS